MGINLLQMNEKMTNVDREPLIMMESACQFMRETLDGVLSGVYSCLFM